MRTAPVKAAAAVSGAKSASSQPNRAKQARIKETKRAAERRAATQRAAQAQKSAKASAKRSGNSAKQANSAANWRRAQSALETVAMVAGGVALTAAIVATLPVSGAAVGVAAGVATVGSAAGLVAAGASAIGIAVAVGRKENDSSYSDAAFKTDVALGSVGIVGAAGTKGLLVLAKSVGTVGKSADLAMDAMWMTYDCGAAYAGSAASK